jgi:site-specific DNA-methyltransferase (adenine-specific)
MKKPSARAAFVVGDAHMETNVVILGDCLDVLRELPDNSIDSVVTDPPYGLSKEPDIVEVLTKWMAGEDYTHRGGGFMGKTWDSFVPGPSIWREVYRVLKPGGHALVFAGTRTQDLMTISLRLAGFEVRDVIAWLYFGGFPKSMDVSKAFDKRAGAERGKIRHKARPGTSGTFCGHMDSRPWIEESRKKGYHEVDGPEPVTDLAKKWDGWGTALKPAHEPIIVARKPLIGTVAENVERWGTGAINIDGCRIPTEDNLNGGAYAKNSQKDVSMATSYGLGVTGKEFSQPEGRFPANIVTTESDAFWSKYCDVTAKTGNVTPKHLSKKASKKDRNSDWKGGLISGEPKQVRRLSGGEYKHNSGSLNSSKNGAVSVNYHPTVKPIDLMAWLIRLITPPGGIVIDPFVGSGSTLVAAKREGFQYIGIERDAEYVEIAKARVG